MEKKKGKFQWVWEKKKKWESRGVLYSIEINYPQCVKVDDDTLIFHGKRGDCEGFAPFTIRKKNIQWHTQRWTFTSSPLNTQHFRKRRKSSNEIIDAYLTEMLEHEYCIADGWKHGSTGKQQQLQLFALFLHWKWFGFISLEYVSRTMVVTMPSWTCMWIIALEERYVRLACFSGRSEQSWGYFKRCRPAYQRSSGRAWESRHVLILACHTFC